MHARTLAVPDAVEFTPPVFPDHRGLFTAPFQEPAFVDAVGHPLTVAQTNHSVSRRGTVRGVHFTDVPPGQAKYVYCPKGALLDVVVDLRVGSPTFGTWDSVRLDSETYRGVYIPEGLGHAFVALEDDTVMSYLCSTSYNPPAEHGVDPFDPELGLPWPGDLEFVLSDKDRAAPSVAQARADGLLPDYADCLAHYERLRASSRA
ncbi:dTDP-4-dehydrorhamnose 3,5-epimerase family protein [Prauserella rugosa]|uniref:dTDP-4-dehydrorhamnose 3,5-epimerase n=1 Tax=Prauserella rugosa TaxID=43354 RepID=A0A660CDL4_9PSEU|nr:dTDP-4-dehydrorhamnose 3,5-epimerase [Prauserella rugosa]KID28657.1 dTDP-4-dehydrorhamnose 3,5-epimerase-like enzyme [Prauserella sp. Am3]KMS90349.1 dTDP-4-dehydrorhamnose 3,5-epimerase [Streptomyces regensis]TWH20494.1 dTDP-4-dehydrorhamnose 3,5-epimerase [Prauserella rugosa]